MLAMVDVSGDPETLSIDMNDQLSNENTEKTVGRTKTEARWPLALSNMVQECCFVQTGSHDCTVAK
jgi:hypothetical protein